jgi:hypothetical protein
MSYTLLYWILMLFWLCGAFYRGWSQGPVWWGPDVLLFILFVILGIHDFGQPVHG